jgi:hypothetical protein
MCALKYCVCIDVMISLGNSGLILDKGHSVMHFDIVLGLILLDSMSKPMDMRDCLV